ncbi:copper chaperone PCu(A)C [Pseudoalteromonas sp. YIC-656]|uniref:copper chaperone PCu(A)C n=1 Tax=Pseudoalteromonas pernae TaxID=3118054 RepID=UPI0032423381
MSRVFTTLMVSAAALFFCTFSFAHSEIMVSDAKVRQFLPASTSSVAYLSIMNHGDSERVLQRVDIESIGRVEIHTHDMQDGMMKMRKLDQLTLQPNATQVFQSGGLHLMLFEPEQVLNVGEDLKMTLYFADGDHVFTQAKVFSLMDEMPSSEGGHKHHHN